MNTTTGPLPAVHLLTAMPHDWLQPTEGGTPFLEVATDAGVLELIPDGSVGLFDPEAGRWVPPAPFFDLTIDELA